MDRRLTVTELNSLSDEQRWALAKSGGEVILVDDEGGRAGVSQAPASTP